MLKELSFLYVEDDVCMQEYMKELLENEVGEFYQAFDGKEGLKVFNEKKPDIILSDIVMPMMDGFEMSKEIKSIDHEQIIIFFSTLNKAEDIRRSIDIHINGFINKPLVDVDDFFKYIESKLSIIKLKNAKRELEKVRLEKEKLEFMLKTIKEITHHWRQPLNVISMHASAFSFKFTNDMDITKEDLENANTIIEQVSKLSSVLKDIESIDYSMDTDIDQLSSLIKISNPLYI